MTKPANKPHYVNNKLFSQSVVDYVNSVKQAQERGETNPIVTEYIATCFLKISEGLSHKPNFIRYTYREEMVMDAVENCLKAIMNYNIETATRTGNPNAFAYFTQICYYAFIRRIQKEKKQFDVKMRFIEQASFEEFIVQHDASGEDIGDNGFIEELRSRIDKVRDSDRVLKEFSKQEKITKKKQDKNLELFMG
jgi:hypothetical protein